MSIHNNEAMHITRPQDVRPRRAGQELKLGVLDTMIGYQLRRAQVRVYQSFLERLADANITPSQLGLLVKIKNNAGISQTALAKANGIERSTLGEIVDRFEKRQWVERRRHHSDRRAYALHLSAEGEMYLNAVLPVALGLESELTASWSENDKAVLLQLLRKLADG